MKMTEAPNLELLRSNSVIRPSELTLQRSISVPQGRGVPSGSSKELLRHQFIEQNLDAKRAELITKVCDQLDIPALRVKSELKWTNPDLTYFHAPNKVQLELPKNRALLLDFLQSECQKFSFRRETYYLSQCYLDSYLEKDQSI